MSGWILLIQLVQLACLGLLYVCGYVLVKAHERWRKSVLRVIEAQARVNHIIDQRLRQLEGLPSADEEPPAHTVQ